ncbi:GIY-YIG nuclease family protein [Halocatena pleomorpha]|uniref:GIY-YIG nuclease family protein n=1 Tax=Halocatena pleomorpha TaxID=1785090 RepID=A0A3P3RAY2_9EURY|nr:GIY-YIG nuclease family protein [Halocatena pleomorpha]RRJ30641.1 GIY-YIG nuclease family protein [Halocatena pleomorpha]
MAPSKAALWTTWINETLLEDIRASDQPDPVPFLTTDDGALATTDALDQYRYGKNDGEYLYLIYLADKPITTPADITPVYVGESRNIGARIYQHYKKLRDALPIDDWEDDGSWGSFSKYDHLAAIRERADNRLHIWILDVNTHETGPYGTATYRHELEAKVIGLIHAHAEYRTTLTNREFVPNRVLHEIGTLGPEWLTTDPSAPDRSRVPPQEPIDTARHSKADLWRQWLETHVHPDLSDATTADPIPVFATDDQLRVKLTDAGRLKRSNTIDARIRAEGQNCVHSKGVRDGDHEGLLYIMYQLTETENSDHPRIVPRYIGKAEAYGKKKELSSNFTEIAAERASTRSFARWGEGDYWHVGELSMALFENDTRKEPWASELFEQGTRRLKEQVYLWTRAWNQQTHVGPYGYQASLAEVEPQLIGLAQAAFPAHLLNKSGVPDDAPIHSTDFAFQTVQHP